MVLDNNHITIEHLKMALDHVDAYVYIKDLNSTYIYANKLTLELFGCREDALSSKKDSDFFPQETCEHLRKIDLQVFEGKKSQEEVKVNTIEDESYKVYWEVKTPIYDNDNKTVIALLGISTDITDQKKLEHQLHKSATTDLLTSLHNRAKISEILEQEIQRAQRYNKSFALCMLDIDHFKTVNDTFGHSIGDELLIEFAQLLKKSVRNSDSIGRWGGEEFILIFPEINAHDAQITAEKIQVTLEQHQFKNIGHKTASLGLTMFAKDDDCNSMIKRADTAMYEAKRRGRNQVVFS